jgi:hypothetical protein
MENEEMMRQYQKEQRILRLKEHRKQQLLRRGASDKCVGSLDYFEDEEVDNDINLRTTDSVVLKNRKRGHDGSGDVLLRFTRPVDPPTVLTHNPQSTPYQQPTPYPIERQTAPTLQQHQYPGQPYTSPTFQQQQYPIERQTAPTFQQQPYTSPVYQQQQPYTSPTFQQPQKLYPVHTAQQQYPSQQYSNLPPTTHILDQQRFLRENSIYAPSRSTFF